MQVVLGVDEDLADRDRLGDEARGLEGLGGVVEDLFGALAAGRLLRFARRLGVLLPHVEVELRALLVELVALRAALLVGGLDQLLGLEALDVALDPVQDPALLAVLLGLVTLAVELDELGDVRRHVVVAGGLGRIDRRAEHVERLEVELGGVDADVLVGVVHRHVAEGQRGLLPVLGLEVGAAAGELDLDVVVVGLLVAGSGLDVADVAVEGGDHPLLARGELLRSELLALAVLWLVLAARGRGQVTARSLVFAALVLRRVDVLVAEHRGVRGLGGERTVRVLGDDRVERRATLLPVLVEVEEVGHGVLDLEDRGPVLLDDAGELELGEVLLLERLGDLVVELRGERHRLLVAGAAHAARAHGLELPRHRRLGHQIRGDVVALELGVVGVLALDEAVAHLELLLQLAHDLVLVAGLHGERGLGDVALVHAVLRPAIAVHQVLIERDALGVVAGVEVVLPEIVHHLERLLGAASGVARERLEEVVGALGIAGEGVDRDDVATRGDGELLGVGQRGVLHAVLDRLLELAHGAGEVALVPVDVSELVVRVAPDLVLGRGVLDDLAVGLLGERPLARIALRLVEEQLAEGEVGVGDELRLGPALDQLQVDLAGVVEIGSLLVLVGEVIEHLVRAARALGRVLRVGVLAPLRVLVLEARVVVDRGLARGDEELVGLLGLALELSDVAALGLGLVGLHPVLGLVAERGGLELDVALGQAPHQRGPIRRAPGRGLEEALQALDLGDQELADLRREAVAPLVTLGGAHRRERVARLRLLITLLQVHAGGRRLEAHGGLLPRRLRQAPAGTRRDRVLRLLRDASVRRRRRARRHRCACGQRRRYRRPPQRGEHAPVRILAQHNPALHA